MKPISSLPLFVLLFAHSVGALCQSSILPPNLAWKGKSEKLIVSPNHPWITPIEKSNFKTTPTYSETMAWLDKLCKESPIISKTTIGKSAQGREINLIIASLEPNPTAANLKNSQKPTLLVQAGIHSGEIDGKDAGMMLLRDLAFTPAKDLLQSVNFLIVPILNVDGHERSSRYNRPNQQGPSNMGWRTNSLNQNLNRDYMKLDSREISAVIEVINQYNPDFYMDIHVTDGADYQYDITYSFVGEYGQSPSISRWMNQTYVPNIESGLKAMGHIPGLFLEPVDADNYRKGQYDWAGGPNFSNCYADLRHLPGLLVETHSLKPYKQRVLGTYVLLNESLKIIGSKGKSLKDSIAKDLATNRVKIPVSWTTPDWSKPTTDSMMYLGISSKMELSGITNSEIVRWLGKKETHRVPLYKEIHPKTVIEKPKGYWVPAQYTEVLERLKKHGIQMDFSKEEKMVNCKLYRIQNHEFKKKPFEGRLQVTGTPILENGTLILPIGSAWISTNQPLGDLAMALLQPESPESFLGWGFFNSIFDRTEYMEEYIVEPLAQQMLNESPNLRTEFEAKKASDPAFAKNPYAILNWFYTKSLYADSQYLLYPVGIISEN